MRSARSGTWAEESWKWSPRIDGQATPAVIGSDADQNWDYRELRERIADGLTLRQFTDFYCAPVPKHDAFQRGVVRLQPRTLVTVNGLLIQGASAATVRR